VKELLKGKTFASLDEVNAFVRQHMQQANQATLDDFHGLSSAGLIRKYKGKFILSKECRKLLAEQGQAGIYSRLFQAFVSEYNWAYGDHLGENQFVQSFLFSLYLLSRIWRAVALLHLLRRRISKGVSPTAFPSVRPQLTANQGSSNRSGCFSL